MTKRYWAKVCFPIDEGNLGSFLEMAARDTVSIFDHEFVVIDGKSYVVIVMLADYHFRVDKWKEWGLTLEIDESNDHTYAR